MQRRARHSIFILISNFNLTEDNLSQNEVHEIKHKIASQEPHHRECRQAPSLRNFTFYVYTILVLYDSGADLCLVHKSLARSRTAVQ